MLGLLAFVLLAVVALYIPPVQNFVVKTVLEKVNTDPAMHIGIDHFRLSPPVNLSASGVSVIQQGDTMVAVNNARLNVAVLPLLLGNVNVDDLILDGVKFNLGTPDSALYLKSEITKGLVDGVSIGLSSHNIEIETVKVAGADVFMNLLNDSTATDTVTASEPLPWKILLHDFDLDTLKFAMKMAPTIDSLGVGIPTGNISEATIDLAHQRIDAMSLTVDSLTATYLTPAVAATETSSVVAPDSVTASAPWEINVGKIHISARQGLYGTTGAVPQPGLDMNYLEVTKVDILIDSLYNRGVEIKVPIKRIAAHERSGLDMNLTGLFTMDEDSMNLDDIHLSTLFSAIDLNAMMGMKSTGLPMPLRVKGKGYLSPNDLNLPFPPQRT